MEEGRSISKAIQGAAMLGGAAAMVVATIFEPALAFSPTWDKILASLAVGGIVDEAAALAQSLTSNGGMQVTVQQPAAPRQIIRGERRVRGTIIYRSTTGGHLNQFNLIIVLAGHESDSIPNLYLDGRQVFWNVGSSGNTTRNGVNFGGDAAGGTHVGPDGTNYDFGTLVYCEARFGDQAVGDVIGAVSGNDPLWVAGPSGSPYVGGCTYVYLKIESDAAMFPNFPDILFTVRGKNDIYDPRTGAKGYSTNWALQLADLFADPDFGFGMDMLTDVSQDQLIAAANVCDEQVALAAGGTESRYASHYVGDASSSPFNQLGALLAGAAGRYSIIGGQIYIWPAYWQGPSFSFGPKSVTSNSLQWIPQKALRDRVNRVNGTYIAANYPYNVAGDLYDSNGWYEGHIANVFPFAFEPTNFPPYAADVLHGYPVDQYLAEDLGKLLPMELTLSTVTSITQAQRLAKIALQRNRQQGSGTWSMGLEAFEMQEADVMQFTFPAMGWAEKVLELQAPVLQLAEGEDGGAPTLRMQMTFAETEASVYDWSTIEELTPYDVPALATQVPWIPAPPRNVTLTSGAGTAIIALDGALTPRVEVQWDEPLDVLVRQLQIQFAPISDPTAWQDAGTADVSNTAFFVGGVVAGVAYDFRIRSVRSNGAVSVWVEIDTYTVSKTLSVVGLVPVTQSALRAAAYSDGTASITVNPFIAQVGNAVVGCLTAGPYTIGALNQGQLYYVYYIDTNFAGGAITPIATQSTSDFRDKVGYFLIGQIVTPSAGSSGGGGGATGPQYRPSASSDTGTYTVNNSPSAYDGDTTSSASIIGTADGVDPGTGGQASAYGQIFYVDFPSIVLGAAATLTVKGKFAITGIGSSISGLATINWFIANVAQGTGNWVELTSDTPLTTWTVTVPSGTNLRDVIVGFQVEAACAFPSTDSAVAEFDDAEIYIQT